MEQALDVLLKINTEYGVVGILVALLIATGWIVAAIAMWRLISVTKNYNKQIENMQGELKEYRDQVAEIAKQSAEAIVRITDKFDFLQTLLVQQMGIIRSKHKDD